MSLLSSYFLNYYIEEIMLLSKNELKNHQIALDLVHSDRKLLEDDKIFILENYQASSHAMSKFHGAFFTPLELAYDFTIEIPDSSEGLDIVDLCAGIGTLSFASLRKAKSLTCVEYNKEYIEVGKRVLPEADWIEGDALSFDPNGKIFDIAISNPPFGNIRTGSDEALLYKGSKFEWKIAEKAHSIARLSSFIIPTMSADRNNALYEKFSKLTGVDFEDSCVDISDYRKQWKGASPHCSIVVFD